MKLFYRLLSLSFLLFSTFIFADEVYQSDQHDFKLVEVTGDLHYPWGMAFLPNGDILVTERDKKRLRVIRAGELEAGSISGLPDNINKSGQGGLLDVVAHPDFSDNRLIYFSYSGDGEGGVGTEVARARFSGASLEDLRVIFKVEPKTRGKLHYGSRLVFAKDGTLFITTGDRYSYMKEAQNPANHLGSVIRINDDGSVPKDSPFVDHADYKAEIYSYGHRNAQGITRRLSDDSIWMHEHGPRGGDEVNKLDQPGANYGWPAITYGIDYSGAIISDKTHASGMRQPIVYWDPSIAPSGMTFYQGDIFPNWQDDLFVGALAKRHLRRLEMDGDKVIAQEVLLKGFARIRDVENSEDGYLYLLTDEREGRLLRLEPVESF